MTIREDAVLLVGVPYLHKERFPATMPDVVRIFDPGLPETSGPEGKYTPATLPFSRQEAARILDELVSLGVSLGSGKNFGNAADISAKKPPQNHCSRTLSEDEREALARFSGNAPKNMPPGQSPHGSAQKTLLLVWDLETRMAEIAALYKQVADAAAPLAEALHGPGWREDAASKALPAIPEGIPEMLASLPPLTEPDWRIPLAAMLAFLPPEAVLVTAHQEIREALHEMQALKELPQERMPLRAHWPEHSQKTLRYAKLPAWQLSGLTHEPKTLPWLCPPREIIVLS